MEFAAILNGQNVTGSFHQARHCMWCAQLKNPFSCEVRIGATPLSPEAAEVFVQRYYPIFERWQWYMTYVSDAPAGLIRAVAEKDRAQAEVLRRKQEKENAEQDQAYRERCERERRAAGKEELNRLFKK